MQIRFGPFVLDLGTRLLTQAGVEIHLSPKAFELLGALALERPNVLSKDSLQHRLWPDAFVAEPNLSNLVAEIREALGDRARAPHAIGIGSVLVTFHARGDDSTDTQVQGTT